jgi:hypothetical protein
LLAYFPLPWRSFVVKILEFFININSSLIILGEPIISTAFITFPAKKITALMQFLYDAFNPRVYDPTIVWKVFSVNQYEYDSLRSITV